MIFRAQNCIISEDRNFTELQVLIFAQIITHSSKIELDKIKRTKI